MSETLDATQVLRERARALARPIAPAYSSAIRNVVVFSLGDERYAIETRYVFTAQRLSEVFPLPGAASHVLGLTTLQGELLVMFDLRVLLGIARPARTEATRMLVLGDKHAELAIIADAVHDVQELRANELFELPAAASDGDSPYLCAVTNDAISLFAADILLADPRLYVDEMNTGLMP
ncbi:MAG TPA: chemotaxis protein CheW [Polyangiales bacterium]|jgi:purine-binding chemotaxis protein CheW|nr:chemotaxis protein CheW [Polyangiales bacterium]